MLWERILVSLDPSVRGFDVSGFEWRLAYDERINDYTEGPDVNLVTVACSALEHLWGDVVRSSANGPLLFSFEIEFGRQTEVTQLNKHFLVNE